MYKACEVRLPVASAVERDHEIGDRVRSGYRSRFYDRRGRTRGPTARDGARGVLTFRTRVVVAEAC
jgi:hypothetical protein